MARTWTLEPLPARHPGVTVVPNSEGEPETTYRNLLASLLGRPFHGERPRSSRAGTDAPALRHPSVAPSPVSHRCHVFLATELSEGVPRRDHEEQDLRSAWFELPEVQRMIVTGILTDAKSVAAFALLSVHRVAPAAGTTT